MDQINWGIIGCGDVTEYKSGPAFNKVPNSRLIAVMRRNAAKAADYASRHGVPKWYTDANRLLQDPDINAIYIATPPSSHAEYAKAALQAGKMVYVEKPMAHTCADADQMVKMTTESKGKLVVAHYRRRWPLFLKVKHLLEQKAIGDVRFVRIEMYKTPPSPEDLAQEKTAWRVNPAIAGGGFFHDLAPHQLDLLYYFFGEAAIVSGVGVNQGHLYPADDMVAGHLLFENGIVGTGAWCFHASYQSDWCDIIGSEGKIGFSFFGGNKIEWKRGYDTQYLEFEPLQHVQQPMIERVVQYFLDRAPNPCTAAEGALIMRWIEQFTKG